MARIDGKRCEHGEDALLVHLDQALLILVVEVGPADDAEARRGESGHELGQVDIVLAGDKRRRAFGDRRQLLRGGHPVGGRLLDAGGDLVLEGGDADLEELIEVGRRDGAELGPFEQRDPRFARQLQDPLVEGEPGQLPVDEPMFHSLNVRGSPTIRHHPLRSPATQAAAGRSLASARSLAPSIAFPGHAGRSWTLTR